MGLGGSPTLQDKKGIYVEDALIGANVFKLRKVNPKKIFGGTCRKA